jgi:hypothetical protein
MIVFLVLLAISPIKAQAPTEYEVKAAYILNFAKFVEWPESAFSSAGSPIVVGIVGEDPFQGAMVELVAGRNAGGRSLVVQRFDSRGDLRHCHIVFISRSEAGRINSILSNIKGRSVLTVADMDGFTQAGGMIQLSVRQKTVQFDISLRSADVGRIKISSKLLSLARSITR